MGTRPNRVTYSVIVPCYNTQPIFVQEVQEIYKTFHDVLKTDSFELILVNDCSPNPETLPFLKKLKEKGVWVGACDMGPDLYYRQDLKGPIAIVIGAEGAGISRLVKEKCDFVVSIPMKGNITSLNASNAASILMYEVVRQRMDI